GFLTGQTYGSLQRPVNLLVMLQLVVKSEEAAVGAADITAAPEAGCFILITHPAHGQIHAGTSDPARHSGHAGCHTQRACGRSLCAFLTARKRDRLRVFVSQAGLSP